VESTVKSFLRRSRPIGETFEKMVSKDFGVLLIGRFFIICLPSGERSFITSRLLVPKKLQIF
jgi:hypothetical protein